MNEQIFIQIPAYRDPELIPTICDLVASAAKPERLRISVCWQHGPEDSLQLFIDANFTRQAAKEGDDHRLIRFFYSNAEILIQCYLHTESLGCGWARAQTQRLYGGEPYALQIDSHHRFSEDWDCEMIEMLEQLRAKSRWPILTGYPPGYDPSRPKPGPERRALQMDFGSFEGHGLIIPRQTWIDNKELCSRPQSARFFSAGFCFSDGHFVANVPYDPAHFFSSEEISMAVRAFTSGYDLYHPHKTFLWHYYLRDDAPKVWLDHSQDAVGRGIVELSADDRAAASGEYIRRLFGLDGDTGPQYGGAFGFGTCRTLEDYEHYAGISFRLRGVTTEVTTRSEPGVVSYSGNEWLDALTCHSSFTLSLPLVGDRVASDRITRISVATFDSDGREVSQSDATDEEVSAFSISGDLNLDVRFRLPALSRVDECLVRMWNEKGALAASMGLAVNHVVSWKR